MKKQIKILISCLVILVVIGASAVIYINGSEKSLQLPDVTNISFLETDFPLFDSSNIEECIGFSDYVFVGKVEAINERGKYRGDDEYYPNGKAGESEVKGMLYTQYAVKIEKNIKGQLQTDKSVHVTKLAGVNDKTNTLVILRGDIMPIVGEKYIFLTRASEKGKLIILDPNGNIPLSEAGNKPVATNVTEAEPTVYESTTFVEPTQTISTTGGVTVFSVSGKSEEEIIQRYLTAYENEKDPLSERVKYKSVYDSAPSDDK